MPGGRKPRRTPIILPKPIKTRREVREQELRTSTSRILISKRPENKYLGGLWEFPGGKLENTERAEDALIRELDEELNIQTWKSCLAPLTFSTHDYTDFNLLLLLFVCRKWDGIIMGREGQEIKWVFPKELNKFPMPDADKPLIPFLRDLL